MYADDKHNLASVENNRIVEIVTESNKYVDKGEWRGDRPRSTAPHLSPQTQRRPLWPARCGPPAVARPRPHPPAPPASPLPAVTRPRDQAVDAELFNFITEASLEYVTKLNQGGNSYTAGDFISRLKTRHVSDTDAQLAGAEDPLAFEW